MYLVEVREKVSEKVRGMARGKVREIKVEWGLLVSL